MKAKIVISLSGGLDSAVMLTLLRQQFPEWDDILTVTFDYGNKNGWCQRDAAERLATIYKTQHRYFMIEVVDQYGGFKTLDWKKSRNMIFASMLTAIAQTVGADAIYFGIHSEESPLPDCRPDFLKALNTAVLTMTSGRVSVLAPLINLRKSEVVRMGLGQSLDFTNTWTCYDCNALSCGRCPACQDRLKAFDDNDAEDPLKYQTRVILPRKGS